MVRSGTLAHWRKVKEWRKKRNSIFKAFIFSLDYIKWFLAQKKTNKLMAFPCAGTDTISSVYWWVGIIHLIKPETGAAVGLYFPEEFVYSS